MTAEVFGTLNKPIVLLGKGMDDTSKSLGNTFIITDPASMAAIQRIVSKLNPELQKFIFMQDDAEQCARNQLTEELNKLKKGEYTNILLNILKDYINDPDNKLIDTSKFAPQQKSQMEDTLLTHFNTNFAGIYAKNHHSLSTSLTQFCVSFAKKLNFAVTPETAKQIAVNELWPRWACAVSKKYITDNSLDLSTMVQIPAPKVAGWNGWIKTLSEQDRVLVVNTDIKWLMSEVDGPNGRGPYVLSSGRFGNHELAAVNYETFQTIKNNDIKEVLKRLKSWKLDEKKQTQLNTFMQWFDAYLKSEIKTRQELNDKALTECHTTIERIPIEKLNTYLPDYMRSQWQIAFSRAVKMIDTRTPILGRQL